VGNEDSSPRRREGGQFKRVGDKEQRETTKTERDQGLTKELQRAGTLITTSPENRKQLTSTACPRGRATIVINKNPGETIQLQSPQGGTIPHLKRGKFEREGVEK